MLKDDASYHMPVRIEVERSPLLHVLEPAQWSPQSIPFDVATRYVQLFENDGHEYQAKKHSVLVINQNSHEYVELV